jgi:hypothetical protein
MGRAVTYKWLHRFDDVLMRLAWVPTVVLLSAFVLVLVQAADRDPPFQLLEVNPASARAGDVVTITARVWRDPDRRCSAEMSRSVFDSQHVRWDYPTAAFSASLIESMEQRSPSELRVSVVVPPNAAIGTAELISMLQYRCNRVHALWPIEVTTVMPFEVIP